MNTELKKVVDRVKTVQGQLQAMLKDRTWIEEARKYAERQGKEVKKLFAGDVDKVKTFIEREKKELERFQKQLPGEVKKIQKFVKGQKKELEKLLKNVRRSAATGKAKTTRKTTRKRKATPSSATETSAHS